jgi:hypothetical protein
MEVSGSLKPLVAPLGSANPPYIYCKGAVIAGALGAWTYTHFADPASSADFPGSSSGD